MVTLALNNSERSALSRLFSTAVFRDLAIKGRSGLFARLFKQSGISELVSPNERVSDAFEAAFHTLRSVKHRDEYVYRAALTHRILLGTHSLNTACMLNEFRVGECKADVAILNGTGTVYEIKSERDSLSRLEKQLDEYKKVFARVFVIAGENHIETVHRTTPKDVGVLCLSDRQSISTLREAASAPNRICPATVFQSIRTAEAKMILRELNVAIPDVPNTLIRSELLELFKRLDPSSTHSSMVRTLKKTRNLLPLAILVESIPPSLKAAAISIPLKKSDHAKLLTGLSTPFAEAMEWV